MFKRISLFIFLFIVSFLFFLNLPFRVTAFPNNHQEAVQLIAANPAPTEEMINALMVMGYSNIKLQKSTAIGDYAMGTWEATNPLGLSLAGIILMIRENGQWKVDLSYTGLPHPRVLEDEGTKVPIEALVSLYESLYPDWNYVFFGD